MHDANKVANRLLEIAAENGDTLTPMQLLKLVYICHGWMLGLYSVPLINDDIEAWKYGPVIPRLYKAVRKFTDKPVEGRLEERDASDKFIPIEENLIKQTYDIYGKMTGPALSRLTHMDGTPWEKTYLPNSFGLKISNDLIEDHYSMLAKRAAA